jgi:hypothetical protein
MGPAPHVSHWGTTTKDLDAFNLASGIAFVTWQIAIKVIPGVLGDIRYGEVSFGLVPHQ